MNASIGMHRTAAKADVLSLTHHLTKEFGPHGVCVNAVAPWTTEGETRRRPADGSPAARGSLGGITFGRFATAEDLSPVVLFSVRRRGRYHRSNHRYQWRRPDHLVC